MFRYVYALAVLNHVSAPFDPVEIAPEIADFGVPLHVLSFVDFYNIARVLDTPVDLIGYFEVRAQILVPTFKPKVHDEQPVFEFYLKHFEELTSRLASRSTAAAGTVQRTWRHAPQHLSRRLRRPPTVVLHRQDHQLDA